LRAKRTFTLVQLKEVHTIYSLIGERVVSSLIEGVCVGASILIRTSILFGIGSGRTTVGAHLLLSIYAHLRQVSQLVILGERATPELFRVVRFETFFIPLRISPSDAFSFISITNLRENRVNYCLNFFAVLSQKLV